jgi:cation transport ATPase
VLVLAFGHNLAGIPVTAVALLDPLIASEVIALSSAAGGHQ